jgi:hypothetical protein
MGSKFESQSYWGQLGITDSDELESRIEIIFDQSNHRENVLLDLYRMIFPRWDQIAMVSGFPEVGRELWTFIYLLFREFDRKQHPDSLPGDAWIEFGFSDNQSLLPWEISLACCTIEYCKCW